MAPSKNFCGNLNLRIMFPHAFSHLFPSPYPMETLEVVCSHIVTYSDPWPPEKQEWYLECIEEIIATHSLPPPPHLPRQSMLSPRGTSQVKRVLLGKPHLLQMTDTESMPGGWEIHASLCCLGTCFPMGPGHISPSGNMFLHVDVCFPMQMVPFFPAFPCIPQHLMPPDTTGGNRLQIDRS